MDSFTNNKNDTFLMVSLESLRVRLGGCRPIYVLDERIIPFNCFSFTLCCLTYFGLDSLTLSRFDILTREGLILTFIMLSSVAIIGTRLRNAEILELSGTY